MWNHLYFHSATLRKYAIQTYLNFFFKMVDDLLQEATLFQQLKVVITQFCEFILRYPNVVQTYIFVEVHTAAPSGSKCLQFCPPKVLYVYPCKA